MKTTVNKLINVEDTSPRGAKMNVNGSVGMVSVNIKNDKIMIYTDEIPTLIGIL